MATPEERIAALEQMLVEQHSYYSVLLNLIIRHDDRLREAVVEAIRKILQNQMPGRELSPHVQISLRELRDGLLAEPPPEVVAAMSRPPVRPVE